jgi:hypothetical protein
LHLCDRLHKHIRSFSCFQMSKISIWAYALSYILTNTLWNSSLSWFGFILFLVFNCHDSLCYCKFL